MPLYAVYALLFSDSGLSTGQISLLFVIWSATGLVLEVPTGTLADRFDERAALVAAGLIRAAGYGFWLLTPRFWGFAAGFVLWGAAGALESGAFQSLLYSGLDHHGQSRRYAALFGRCQAVSKVGEVTATMAAAPLLLLGGMAAVGWASVAVCLVGSAIAAGLPAGLPAGPGRAGQEEEAGYGELLRGGVREALGQPTVRRLVLVVSVVTALTAVDEYVPLLARSSDVPDALIPLVAAGLPLAGAAGNALAGLATRFRPATVALTLLAATAVMVGTAAAGGVVLLVVLYGWWALVNLAIVVSDARLQDVVADRTRATVTSVAGLNSEVLSIALFLAAAALA